MRLIVILLIAAFLRIYQLGSVPIGFYCDEAMDGNNALEVAETGHFQVFYPENNGREGLYINLATPFVYLLGNTVAAMRLPAAVFGVLTVWMVYLVAGEIFSTPIGLLAAFFVATSSWDMHVTRITHRAGAATFFLVLACYVLLRAVRRIREGKPYLGMMLLAGAVYGLGFHTYLTYRATPLLVGAVWIYGFFRARAGARLGAFWRASAAFAAGAAVVAAPLLAYFMRHKDAIFGRAAQVSVLQTAHPALTVAKNIWPTAQMFFFTGDPNWRHNLSGQAELFWPVAILFALGVAGAVLTIVRPSPARAQHPAPPDKAFAYALLLGWLVVGALPVILSYDSIHAFRSSLMIPSVFVLAATGAHRAYGWLFGKLPRGVGMAAVAGFLLFLCGRAFHVYFDVWADNPFVLRAFDSWLVDAAGIIGAAPRDIPRIIAIPKTSGDVVNGVPVFLQPVVYLTRTYTANQRALANLRYVLQPPADSQDAWSFCIQVRDANPGAQVFCLPYAPDLAAAPLPLRP